MFCTNGVLLRMLTSGQGLKDVTHIVVDEIHERDKFADFLLIMLRDLLPSQPQLRLVLMSATLDAALFTDYFNQCPLMDVPGFTHPVQVSSTTLPCTALRAYYNCDMPVAYVRHVISLHDCCISALLDFVMNS